MRSAALFLIGIPLLVGCQPVGVDGLAIKSERTDDSGVGSRFKETHWFRIEHKESKYDKLSDDERDELIRHLIEVLRTPLWREAEVTLTQIGKPSIPYLIDALSRADETASEQRPRPGPKFDSERMFNTLGEVAWSVLKDMIIHHSNLRTRGGGRIVLPERHEQERWRSWWRKMGGLKGSLAISSPVSG